jgi:Flp pilus assembly protein TadD
MWGTSVEVAFEGLLMSITLNTSVTARACRRFAPALIFSLIVSACAQSDLETGALQLGQNAEAWNTETVKGENLPPPRMTAKSESVSLNMETAAAIRDARKIREGGNKARALGILEKTPDSDKDKALILERGLITLEMGQIDKAVDLLKQAYNPEAPDWRQHSALGAALSAKGDQQAAQAEFDSALKLSPNNPSILNNLALSYALDGKHAEAERILRNIAEQDDGKPQAKQNLALILGLRGNIEEARKVSESVLPPEKVKSNVAYLERLNAAPEQVSRVDPPAIDDLVQAAQAGNSEPDKPISEMGLVHSN